MSNVIQHSKKQRREIIVNKLIAFNIYDKEDVQLHHLSINQLENEFRRFKSVSHPHDGLGSLRIRWKKK